MTDNAENLTDEMKQRFVIRAVDDDAAMRSALSFMLEAEGWRVETYASGREFLTQDSPSVPGAVILDVRMPEMSGLELQQEMLRRGYKLPVIFLTGHGDIEMAVGAMRDGAADFVQKPVEQERLLNAIVRGLRRCGAPSEVTEAEMEARVRSLTPREADIARLVGAGLTNRQISERQGISVRTVEVHRATAIRKLGVRTPAEIRAAMKD